MSASASFSAEMMNQVGDTAQKDITGLSLRDVSATAWSRLPVLPPALLLLFYLNSDYPTVPPIFRVAFAASAVILVCVAIPFLRRLFAGSPFKGLDLHLPWIALLVSAVLFHFRQFISLRYVSTYDGAILTSTLADIALKKFSLLRYHTLPLWSPYQWSGYPMYALPDRMMFSISTLIALIFPLPGAINANTVLVVILSGLTMYALLYHLQNSRGASFVGGLGYALSGYAVQKSIMYSFLMGPYAWLPLVMLFLVKAFQAESTRARIQNAIFLGLSLGIAFHAGSPENLIYFGYFVLLPFTLITALTKRNASTWKNLLIVGLIATIVLGGVTAVKILPSLSFAKFTNRDSSWPRSDIHTILEGGFKWPALFRFLIRSGWERLGTYDHPIGPYSDEEVGEIGLVVGILAALALPRLLRKRVALGSAVGLMLSVLFASWSTFYNFMWDHAPLVGYLRYPGRVLPISLFCIVVLASYGYKTLETIRGGRFARSLAIFVTMAVLAELTLWGQSTALFSPRGAPWLNNSKQGGMVDFFGQLEQNKIIQYIRHQPGFFRIHAYQVKGIDWAITPTTIPYGIEVLFGQDTSVWIPEYMNEYLSIAFRNPSVFWGILNTRFITSSEPIEADGLRLLQEFEPCTVCGYPDIASHFDGPYLYENERFLPRAYIAPRGILVVGDYPTAKNAVYTLMLHPLFDPRGTAIVMRQDDSARVPENLPDFAAVLLVQRPRDEDLAALRSYSDAGGVLVPNIFNESSLVTNVDLTGLLQFNSSPPGGLAVRMENPNSLEVDVSRRGGFLVLSEKFFMFPEWTASMGSTRVPLFRANGMVTAVPAQEGTMRFKYAPPLFFMGLVLMLLTLCASLFALLFLSKRP